MHVPRKVKHQVEKLGLTLTGSPRVWTALIALLFAVWGGKAHAPTQAPGEQQAAPAPQEWTAGAEVLPALVRASAGALPSKPVDRQLTSASECKWPARFMRGGCWLEVGSVPPPCLPPDGHGTRLYEHEGRCWAPVLRAERPPPPESPGRRMEWQRPGSHGPTPTAWR